MKNLHVHDWDIWQTFRKDRGTPSWIKMHRSLMTCQKWATLSDAEKGQMVSIWIIAADKGGYISKDPVVIKKICQLDSTPDIEKFIELQLLDVC
jgi:hypothetical protein